MRDKRETSVKSCGPEHSEHPEWTGRQVGDKPEIMRAENRECSGRQLGDKCERRQVETGGREM